MPNTQSNIVTRRKFAGAMAGAGSFMIAKPSVVRGSSANSALRLGLLGCGGRGTTVARAFLENTNTRMVALADLFSDKLESRKRRFDEMGARHQFPAVDRKQMFLGANAYEEIANSSDVDVIIIATPDYFHPKHLEAVVEAGKHVYCEKPAAVDVEGCLRFMEIGKRARGRLSLEVGFQVRRSKPFSEIVNRIHSGVIGKVACIDSHYHATEITYPERPGASPLEKRIRNFYWDRVLSGDVLVDQNIHIIDICNWALKAHPVKSVATGGRTVRQDAGNTWDHWSVILTYPSDIKVTFNSVQFGKTLWDVGCRFFGDQGVAECYYSGAARVIGDQAWEIDVDSQEGLAGANESKVKSFEESIRTGKFHNESEVGATSALSAILGRTAAYTGEEVSWDELIRSNQSYAGAIDLTKL